MSAAANTASGLGATCAPAARYASSVAPMPAPAPVSTSTLCPCATISRTDDGVRPTRYSLFLISFGTPTCILPPVWDCRSAAKTISFLRRPARAASVGEAGADDANARRRQGLKKRSPPSTQFHLLATPSPGARPVAACDG